MIKPIQRGIYPFATFAPIPAGEKLLITEIEDTEGKTGLLLIRIFFQYLDEEKREKVVNRFGDLVVVGMLKEHKKHFNLIKQ